MTIIERIVLQAHDCGIDEIVFTGGEPTIHRAFGVIVRQVAEAGYRFGFVSNGANFPKIYPLLLQYRSAFNGVTFSLDGAHPASHDRLRGKGSFRRVMRAATLCVFKDLPFTINMVVTRDNRQDIPEMVRLAANIGSAGLRFGHFISAPSNAAHNLDLLPDERRAVEAQIWQLRETAELPVGMGPGYYYESFFFPCGPLEQEEYNVDYRGNMTLCCHLSGLTGTNAADDIIADLKHTDLASACARFGERVETYLRHKREKLQRNELDDLDHFPCLYCVKYLGKAPPTSAMFGNRSSINSATGDISVVSE